MSIPTTHPVGDPPGTAADLATPGSFQVSTLLMEDAVPARTVLVHPGQGRYEALFANPFLEGAEEALVIDTDSSLTYLRRSGKSDTGWEQTPVAKAPKCAQVMTAVHPNG